MKISRFNLKSLIVALLVGAPLFISCKDKTTTVEEPVSATQEASLEQKKQALENVSPTTNTINASGDVALNPAHGQPGHRCDIAVGAPLNGTAEKSNTTTTPQKIDLNNMNATPPPTSGGGKLNPAHGQPGHRCDIKVGDPL